MLLSGVDVTRLAPLQRDVTTVFQDYALSLPLWIFDNLFRPNQAPVVNVVAAVLIVLSIMPIWASQPLSGDTAGGRL